MTSAPDDKSDKTTSPRSPTDEDAFIGMRIRLMRNMLNMSQEEFAAKLDISFQQLQKYETGKNRITARLLNRVSQMMDVPIGFFFEGAEHGNEYYSTGDDKGYGYGFGDNTKGQSPFESEDDPFKKQETFELIRAYYSIKSPKDRKKVLVQMRKLADKD